VTEVDYGATALADENREKKARALAAWCYEHGLDAARIAAATEEQVRHMAREAGVNPPRPDSPTWPRVVELLEDRAVWDAAHPDDPSVIQPVHSEPSDDVPSCQHWFDGRYCGATPARAYLPGRRCAEHTPSALAGRPEPCPPPDSTLEALLARKGNTAIGTPNSASQLVDDRAIASGKRRSGVGAYRAARGA
jgi:hypothetical protein